MGGLINSLHISENAIENKTTALESLEDAVNSAIYKDPMLVSSDEIYRGHYLAYK